MKNKKPLKFLLFSEFYTPHWTGIVATFAQLAEDLAKNNKVTVVTTRNNIKLPENEIVLKQKIIRLPYSFKLSRTYYSFETLWWTMKYCIDFDVIGINSPHSNVLFLTFIAKLAGKKVFIYHQGDLTLPRQTGNLLVHWVMERIFDLCTIPAMGLADKVGTYTKDYAEHSRVMRYFLYKLFLYIPVFRSNTTKRHKISERFQKKLSKIKKGHVVIGFGGRFVEEKGFDILFQAIPQVVSVVPNAVFVFAGEKNMSYEPFFEKTRSFYNKAKKYIEFLGLLEKPELASYYSALDLFVLSSRSDCFPVTQIEAVTTGVPIVVTDIPGARMVVKESGFGAIAKSEDPDDLAEKIIRTLTTPKTPLDSHKKLAQQFLTNYSSLPFN